MRQITKDIQITIDGSLVGFRLFKLDAFSGVTLLRLLMRLETGGAAPTMLDLIGPHPVMTGSEWGYPELEHDTPTCMKLLLEGIAWSLSGFFGGGQSKGPESDQPDTAR